jgi:hypothetical protein
MSPPSSFLRPTTAAIDRLPYLVTGLVLFLVKYGIDWLISTQLFGRPWTPLNYLIWPDERTLHIFDLPEADRVYAVTLLAVSLPFICIGVILTVYRLRAAQLPLPLILLFFLPIVNLVLFLVLVIVPTRPLEVEEVHEPLGEGIRLIRLRKKHLEATGGSAFKTGLLAVALSVPLTAGVVALGAVVLQNYGFGLFVGSPFALGLISVLLFGFSRPQSIGNCIRVALAAGTLVGLVILLLAFEGALCLIMLAPFAYVLTFLGALVGYAIQSRPWASPQSPYLCLALLAFLPGVMAAESLNEAMPEVRAVRTEVVIAASPERVWQNVIAFPPLAEPDDWLFRSGIAYPKCATIQGTGPGAVRHCVFSTGAFVEPIDVWDAPTLLRFRVTDQPPPMQEWSPYEIHPPHLDHYLVSQQGEFRLTALPDGRTRLEGTTWYTNRMWPAAYWGLWSDYIIHRIHLRVLEHIRSLAEAEPPGAP